jgi:hypothetical protein
VRQKIFAQADDEFHIFALQIVLQGIIGVSFQPFVNMLGRTVFEQSF